MWTSWVKLVCLDVRQLRSSGCRETFPAAVMVFDHFHVIKLLNVQSTAYVGDQENGELKETKFLWLKNPENGGKRTEFQACQGPEHQTTKAYQFKLAIKHLGCLRHQKMSSEMVAWAEQCNMQR